MTSFPLLGNCCKIIIIDDIAEHTNQFFKHMRKDINVQTSSTWPTWLGKEPQLSHYKTF